MITLAPVAVAGTPLTINFQGKYPDNSTRNPIRVANESQYQAVVLAAGVSLTLDPYTADVLRPIQRVTQISATFTGLSSPLPVSPVNQLIVTLAQDGEDFPGSYPMSVPRQQATFAQPNLLSPDLIVPGDGIAHSVSLQIPSSTSAVRILPIPASAPGANTISFAVTGDQSGVNYWPGSQSGVPQNQQEPLNVAVDSELDTSVTVKATATNLGPAWVVQISALSGVQVVEVRSQHPLTMRPLIFDWTASGQFTNGAASLASPAAPAGRRPVVGAYAVRAASSAATAYGSGITFTDSVSGQAWEDGVSIPATADAADHASLSSLAIAGSVGGVITMAMAVNPPANIFVDMSFGGWFL